jgi:tetratricopeptide (TPR) repeat protein
MNLKGKCFVIMGYGEKTDLATGRKLNLDKTYKNIIKPAAEEAGLSCMRADEIRHSGIIDVPMYEQLIDAEVVITDLSTYNVNAFYELGIRHALRPRTTIVIAENELRAPFDVNHTRILQYEHLGKDIGCDEASRFKKELVGEINEILTSENVDSPVYTYLKGLKPPAFENSAATSEGNVKEKQKETLGHIIERAVEALERNDFTSAKAIFQYAHLIDPNDKYIIQKLVLATYKSKYPNAIDALREALTILEKLKPENTTDSETLGLSGAIHKRLWEELNCIDNLNQSIFYYEKGFYIRNDYYNGINAAYLLTVRGKITKYQYDAITDYTIANRIRAKVITICESLYHDKHFRERSDQYWIVATLEEAYFTLGDKEKYAKMAEASQSISKQNWERETTEKQIERLRTLLDDAMS